VKLNIIKLNMKKLIFTLITLFTFTPCEKKQCWKCTVSSQAPGYVNTLTQTTTTVCDQTASDIENYEKAGTMTTVSNGITVETVTNCQSSQ
jgi:hypothetical protein